jgi:hypothetical protein
MEVLSIIIGVLGIIGIGALIKWSMEIWLFIKSFGKPRRFMKEAEELGIKKIWSSRGNAAHILKNIFDLNEGQKPGKVQFMGQSLAWLKAHGDEPLRRLLNEGCKFEFLLLDPQSPLMACRTAQENQDLQNEATGFINWIQGTFDAYKKQIELRVHGMTPTMGMTIIDEKHLFVSPYAMTKRTHVMPTLELSKGGKLFRVFSEEFFNIWNEGKTRNW